MAGVCNNENAPLVKIARLSVPFDLDLSRMPLWGEDEAS